MEQRWCRAASWSGESKRVWPSPTASGAMVWSGAGGAEAVVCAGSGAGNAAVADPQVMMRRRINNKATWTNERWKSLGQVGQHEPFIDWRRNGIYKTCQYEFCHTDDSDFVISGASELIEPLNR